MNSPETFRAGDSVTWTESLAEYLASAGWVLKYRMLWQGGTAVPIIATASGDNFTVTLTAAETATWDAGSATLVSWVEKGTDRVTLGEQDVTILPNLAIANAFDGRSRAVKGLADARAALDAYMAGGKLHVAEYDVAGRRMKFRSSEEITDLISYYEREVAKENAANAILQGQTPGRIYSRM